MKKLYFVTEGPTDKIVLEGLIAEWLNDEDFVSTHVQPPESAYAENLQTKLSSGWKGVVSWCSGERPAGPAGRNYALAAADCLIVHIDAEVAKEIEFRDPIYAGPCPPARNAADWVRAHVSAKFETGILPPKTVLCVPAQDLEAWTLTALHPDIAGENMPIECLSKPGALLAQGKHRLVRRKDGALKKNTQNYRSALRQIVRGWPNCVEGENPRCPEAVRFEQDARTALGI